MSTLFNDSEVFQKERPTGPTEKQLEAMYAQIAQELIDDGYSEDDLATITEDIKNLYPFNQNGYELAKELEDNGCASYEFNAEFVEWLDWVCLRPLEIKSKNILDWVKAHNPQPKFAIGTKLYVMERLSLLLNKDQPVYIVGIDEQQACYVIHMSPTQTMGSLIAYERVESLCTPVEDAQPLPSPSK
jgi:hypothetical protein